MSAPVKHQWFLPHYSVTNRYKPGKVCRVFNATFELKEAFLNYHLITGPNLFNSLIIILMCFCEKKIFISTEIESMFLQVVVPNSNQTVIYFLWWEDNSLPTEVYQYCHHIFGTKSSPTSVNYFLHWAANDNPCEFPCVVKAIMKNFMWWSFQARK